MNSITSIGIYLIVLGFILAGVVFYLKTFESILNFKWYIDFFYSKDKTCLKKNWTKLEIESYRYNLYVFLYGLNDSEAYQNIYNNYKLYYYLFITYFVIFLFLYLFTLINYSHFDNLDTSLYSYLIFFIIFMIYIVYVVVNGILLSKFERINNIISDKNSAINAYHNTYVILNTILYISNLEDAVLEYSNSKLNENKYTFGTILESNIASYENLFNLSKIKQIKLVSYDNLDFLKYFTFDRLSSYYLKYFDNVYIRLPEESTQHFDISENTYLSDIYLRRNASINYDLLKLKFDDLKDYIKDDLSTTYKNIYTYMSNNYPSTELYNDMQNYFSDIYKKFNNDKTLESYNKSLYDNVIKVINEIDNILKSQIDIQIYNEINRLIHDKLEEKNIILEIENNDYVKYYLDNKDILFDSDYDRDIRFKDLSEELNGYTNYVYAYFVYFILIFFALSHYLFKTINNIYYVLIMLIIIGMYFSYGYYKSYRFT